MSIEPVDGVTALIYSPGPAGLLQWSSRFGGGETATITPSGADLDVFAFEESPNAAKIVYLNMALRGDTGFVVLTVGWRVKVQVVSDDGAIGGCEFFVRSGSKDDHTEMIRASTQGTMYGPVVEDVTPRGGGRGSLGQH